jgi:hypothetical protein
VDKPAHYAEHIKQGGLGKVQRVHVITYNARLSIGKVSDPQPIPATAAGGT